MIQNTKCDCGHQNPVGTVLCEYCGKPLQEEELQSDMPLEMRYDGVARRSQKANPNLVDRIWNFFSSVKVAVYLILITLIATAQGSFFPQQADFVGVVDFDRYYEENYGWIGTLYHNLGLTNTFASWWFRLLLVMIGASLVVCSLDRVLPLYRALNKQSIRKHERFLLRQKIRLQAPLAGSLEQEAWLDSLEQALRKKHYRVHRGQGALLAEKYRFSRWGPYINHIGLIIFLIAVLMYSMTSWTVDYFEVREGQMKQIPKTNYYLENQRYEVEMYENSETVKEYLTKAAIYRCVDNCGDGAAEPLLEKLREHEIQINKPLKWDGLAIYNVDFEYSPIITAVTPELVRKSTGEVIGSFRLDLVEPKPDYVVGDYRLTVKGYYPDAIYRDGKLATQSNEANAPAFVFAIDGPNLSKDGEIYLYFVRPADKIKYRQDLINEAAGASFQLDVASMEDVEISQFKTYFNISYSQVMPFIWIGLGISMLGLILGFYWHHRRIWLRVDGRLITLGAHTNKNWYGLRKEVAEAMNRSGLPTDPKLLQNEVNEA